MQSATNQSLDNDSTYSAANHASEGSNVMLQSKLSSIYSRWHADIVNNRKRTVFFPDNLICTIKIKVLSDGNLSYLKMEKSSGNQAYDYFSEQAIHKSSPFYMPEDPILIKELIETEHILYFDDSAFS